MAHGRTPLPTREKNHLDRSWLAALLRGIILGLVICLHLGVILLLLGPVMPYRPSAVAQSGSDSAQPLTLRLLAKMAKVAKPRRANPLPVRPLKIKPVTRRASFATSVTSKAAEVAPTTTVAVEPPAVAGDYHSPLLSGEGRAAGLSVPRVPGSDAARVQGISLDHKPSLRDTVRELTKANRCGYERMKMQRSTNQFVTTQLMNRALEADGCGPGAPRTQADETADAISHRVIFGD